MPIIRPSEILGASNVMPVAGQPAATVLDEQPAATATAPAAFRHEVDAFMAGILHSAAASVSPRDARNYAYYAVTEAHRWGIPPSLVLGVMLQENARFIPDARSVVGAVGLMQVLPRLWVPNLGARYGTDLTDPQTNIRYGVHILAHFARLYRGDWEQTLAAYSGNARNYPTLVMSHIRRHGEDLCDGLTLDACTGRPLYDQFVTSGGPVGRPIPARGTGKSAHVATPVRGSHAVASRPTRSHRAGDIGTSTSELHQVDEDGTLVLVGPGTRIVLGRSRSAGRLDTTAPMDAGTVAAVRTRPAHEALVTHSAGMASTVLGREP
jgi:hypothetical protein